MCGRPAGLAGSSVINLAAHREGPPVSISAYSRGVNSGTPTCLRGLFLVIFRHGNLY